MDHDEAVRSARDRRFALQRAMRELEESVQSPAATSDWREKLAEELDDLDKAWREHVETVEGPNGIIEQAILRAPRTSARGDRLRNDHPLLSTEISAVIDLVDRTDELTVDAVDAIREGVGNLLISLHRHRARGSDFVWEAYDLDIGGLG
jgi:hypothetical protein